MLASSSELMLSFSAFMGHGIQWEITSKGFP